MNDKILIKDYIMTAKKGNTNAQKGKEKINDRIALRVHKKDREKWEQCAAESGVCLSQWAVKSLNKVADNQQ